MSYEKNENVNVCGKYIPSKYGLRFLSPSFTVFRNVLSGKRKKKSFVAAVRLISHKPGSKNTNA